MLERLGSADYPHDVELGLEPDPCGERFLDVSEPEIVPEACAECGGAEHWHCLACRSVTCQHVIDLVKRLVAR